MEVANATHLGCRNGSRLVMKIRAHTIKVFFASGKVLDVHCGIKSDAPAVWNQDANGFIQTIHNTDSVKNYGGNPPS